MPKVRSFALLALAALMAHVAGCTHHTPVEYARAGVEGSAQLLAAVDSAAAAKIALEGSQPHDSAAFRARWEAYEARVLAVRAALLEAEHAVADYESIHGAPAGCRAWTAGRVAVDELERLRDALPTYGIDVPTNYADVVTSVVRSVAGLAGSCSSPDGGAP